MARGGLSLIKRTGGIDTSDANAGPYQILEGYSGYVDDDKIEGTMPNRGAHMYSLPVNTSYNIPDGWHNGDGKITQSLETQDSITVTPGTTPKLVCAADRWTTGNLWVAGDADLVAGNIKVDVNLFGLTGTYRGCVTTDATVTAAQILTGYSAYGSAGTKIAGTMPNQGAISHSLSVDGSYTIPAGWHNGNGKVTQSLTTQAGWTATPGTGNILLCSANRWTTGDIWAAGNGNLVAGNIKKGVTIFGVTGTYDKYGAGSATMFDGTSLGSAGVGVDRGHTNSSGASYDSRVNNPWWDNGWVLGSFYYWDRNLNWRGASAWIKGPVPVPANKTVTIKAWVTGVSWSDSKGGLPWGGGDLSMSVEGLGGGYVKVCDERYNNSSGVNSISFPREVSATCTSKATANGEKTLKVAADVGSPYGRLSITTLYVHVSKVWVQFS